MPLGNVDNSLIYHKAVLLPFWILEVIGELIVISFSARALAYLIVFASDDNSYCYYDSYGNSYCSSDYYSVDDTVLGIGYGVFGAALGLGAVFLLMHAVQIVLYSRRKLTPAANFGFELTRVIVWLAVLGLAAASLSFGITYLGSQALIFILWALYLGSLIYASVIFHRSRRGQYNGTLPSAYPHAYGQQPQMSYGPGPYQQPGHYQQPSQYQQPGPYQQPSQYPQHGNYQQPGNFQQPSQYAQPSQYQQQGPPSQTTSPQPMHGQAMYAPPAPAQSPPPQDAKYSNGPVSHN